MPDLPGCVAVADTREETEQLIREGIGYYIEELQEMGEPVPRPGTWTSEVAIIPAGRRPEREVPTSARYAAIYERSPNNWSAYVPDLPGCIAAADTREETERLIREGIGYHIEALQENGDPVPLPGQWTSEVEVEVELAPVEVCRG